MRELAEGFPAYVRIGDTVSYQTVFCPIAVVIGDGKSQDMLCGRYGGKKTGRVCRACMVSFDELDDPDHNCQWLSMKDIEVLYKGATNTTIPKKHQKMFQDKLQELSTHIVDNAFFPLHFGANKHGVMTTTSGDLLHMVELGLFPYIITGFVGSMFPRVKANVDTIMGPLFENLQSAEKVNHLRMNFTKGSTSLTLLKAHKWPGLTMAFMIMLLTQEGKAACATCFSDTPAILPHKGINPVYNPEAYIIEPVGLDVDPEPEAPPDEDNADNNTPDDQDADEEDTDIDDEDEDVDDEDLDEEIHNDRLLDIDVLAKAAKTKIKKTIPLICTSHQLVDLLEQLLLFHAWYKYGLYHGRDARSQRSASQAVRRLLAKIKAYMPRQIGYGWKLQKFHELLHLLRDIVEWGSADNYDASHGERGLRTWAKAPASTSQKRGKTFMGQVVSRVHERSCFTKAQHVMTSEIVKNPHAQTPDKLGLVGNRKYIMRHSRHGAYAIWMTDANNGPYIHPLIIEWFSKSWPAGEETIRCWTEYYQPNGDMLRAHPNFRKTVPSMTMHLSDLQTTITLKRTIPASYCAFFRRQLVPLPLFSHVTFRVNKEHFSKDFNIGTRPRYWNDMPLR